MRLQHFIITRFSYRTDSASPDVEFLDRTRPPRSGEFDPLEPAHLERRLRLLEIIAGPSVLAQTSKDFTWVVIVDRELPEHFRARLSALIERHPRTVIHEYDPAQTIGGTDWLQPYVSAPAPDYLLTSNLDDDDALPRRFAEEIQRWALERGDDAAPLEFFGSTDSVEWDLAVSRSAPLGYRAAWHRPWVPVTSVGVSLLARYPDYPVSIMGIHHSATIRLLDWAVPDMDDRFGQQRPWLERLAEEAGDSLRDHDPATTFHDTLERIGPPLVANHDDNAQAFRLYERKRRVRVTGPESFPDHGIDWATFQSYAGTFRASRVVHARHYLRQARFRWRRIKHAILDRLPRRRATP